MDRHHNYQIDMLRTIAAFMVVSIHVGRYGFDIMNQAIAFSGGLWCFRIFSYPAVNLFGLISGYVGIEAEYKTGRILYQCVHVSFILFAGTTVMKMVMPGLVGVKDFFKCLFPVGINYWYFTAYIGVYVLAPLINVAVKKTEENKLRKILVSIVILFSVMEMLLPGDAFQMNAGFSVIWLAIMYLIGACFRLYHRGSGRPFVWLLIYMVVGILCYGTVFLLGMYGLEPDSMSRIVNYTSPLILIMAVGLFLYFIDTDLKSHWLKQVVIKVAPLSFGSYLVHMHPLFKTYVLCGLFVPVKNENIIMSLGIYICASCGIFVLSLLVDYIRLKLFDLMKVRKLCERLGTFMDRVNTC